MTKKNMGKTFLIGFIGLFLVGGFVTGLYLINQQTNPASRASEETELVNPVAPPVDSGQNESRLVPPDGEASPSMSLADCQTAFGAKSSETNYISSCDLDQNGIINVLDLSKLK